MHFNFIRGPKAERVRFFQSSIPYLNSNAVALRKSGNARKWSQEEPHPSNHRILTLANGHYGIYFTIFNHELRREERSGMVENTNPLIVLVVPSSPLPLFMPDFFISRANQDIHNDITELKSVSQYLLSTTSLLNPRRYLGQFLMSKRGFRTSARILDRDNSKQPPEPQHLPVNEVEEPNATEHILKVEELPETAQEPVEEPFESSFKRSQENKIVSTFAAHTSPDDLNIIYPLYQSLKRNGIVLSSIYEYNIVLKSIAMRSLDSEHTLEATESRLTCLLTVYQDILAACSQNPECKPNYETFNIVLDGIFDGAVRSIRSDSSISIANDYYQTAMRKSEEFCQVGIKLFMSVKDQNELDLKSILPNLIATLNMHPNLLHKKLISDLIDICKICTADGSYYVGLFQLSKYLKCLNVLESNAKVYEYITSIFEQYKAQAQIEPCLVQVEYEVYSALIQSLVYNGNLSMATKFLDDILVDFKESMSSISDKLLNNHKLNVSELISTYLQALMASGKREDLNKSYNMLQKFLEVPYIPELSVQFYNDIINRFINEYTLSEINRSQGVDVASSQRILYTKIWELYDRVAIRKDFQNVLVENNGLPDFGLNINCREFLLSLSLDLGDHSQVTRLLKEIMLKNHTIKDWNVSKKLCLYFYNGISAYGNTYYFDLLWNFVEQQTSNYFRNSKVLNSFLSEHVSFLLFENSENFNRILDSHMVYNAFSKFSLRDDNIYGVMSIATFLMHQYPSEALSAQAFKLMQFEACLINEFEDSENHYLQLSPELVQLKRALAELFAFLYSSTPNMRFSCDISDACRALELDLITDGLSMENVVEKDFKRDLSALFTVNRSVAVTEFLETFKLGCSFNELTWNSVINMNFVYDVLEREKYFSISEFVQRIVDLNLGVNAEVDIFSNLIRLNSERTNIEILKFLIKDHIDLLSTEEVMSSLVDFSNVSENKYFLDLLVNNLEIVLSRNSNSSWLSKLFSKLNNSGHAEKISILMELNKQKLVFGLDLTNPNEEELLRVELMALLALGKSDEINQIFKYYFDGKEGNTLLLKSDKLLECLLNHYIAMGAYEDVVTKFGPLQERSSGIKQLIQFAQLMCGLNKTENHSKINNYADSNTVGLAILNERDVFLMRDIFQKNQLLISDKEQFFNFLIMCLSKASLLSGELHSSQINNRFESIIKLCKVMRLNEISVPSLINIIKLLALTNAKGLLSILVNKFVNGNKLSPFVNIYFLQVKIESPQEASLLLNAFKSALLEVGDDVNAEMIAEYEVGLA
ncbi:CIC11C00000004752 [Sungouiella intermedia]|uniref:CIC11C00000004752 n=1 Tax=Sungouiella intermedia TaxID=45354 RepID=A0A1L0DCG4_9ASCO|nr:CIC11C00000004752 [[Candida] intermedia]